MYCRNCQNANAIINGYWVCLSCPQYQATDIESHFGAVSYKNILRSVYISCCLLFVFSIVNLSNNLLRSNHNLPLINIYNLSTGNTNTSASFSTIKPGALQQLPQTTKIVAPTTEPITEDHIVVSIGQQHLWAYDGTTQVYSSSVITGASDLGEATPIGTWKIYAKSSDVYLRGPTWDDFVQYWMPFFGAYGLHDASWRSPTQFGTSTYPQEGSHGCVELPTATATWLYNWAAVGTSITIEN